MADLKKAIETVQDMLDVMESAGSCYAYKHNGGDNRLRNVLDCLRAQQEAEKNDPLALDELRTMDGEPVWGTLGVGWKICYGLTDHRGYLCMETGDGTFICMDHYGKDWLAYRRKPEEGAK